ncbi:MAG: InlB B-repeat-containing protein, partial [Suipraeoptans sp.]
MKRRLRVVLSLMMVMVLLSLQGTSALANGEEAETQEVAPLEITTEAEEVIYEQPIVETEDNTAEYNPVEEVPVVEETPVEEVAVYTAATEVEDTPIADGVGAKTSICNVTFSLRGGNVNGSAADVVWADVDANAYPNLETYAAVVGGMIPDPTRDGYTFLGWTADGDDDFVIMPEEMPFLVINGNITYNAKWKSNREYTITFNLKEGNVGGDTSPVIWVDVDANAYENLEAYAAFVGEMIPEPTRDGYEFLGWTVYTDDDFVIMQEEMPFLSITESTRYNAKWEKTEKYTITFDLKGGDVDGDTANVVWEDVDAKLYQ